MTTLLIAYTLQMVLIWLAEVGGKRQEEWTEYWLPPVQARALNLFWNPKLLQEQVYKQSLMTQAHLNGCWGRCKRSLIQLESKLLLLAWIQAH